MLNPEADDQRNNYEDGYRQNGLPLLGHASPLPFIEIVLLNLAWNSCIYLLQKEDVASYARVAHRRLTLPPLDMGLEESLAPDVVSKVILSYNR